MGSWLSFIDLSLAITITTVRSCSAGGGVFGGGGCGASTSRPCGVSGVITMKMISSTSSTSISGVTLMSHFAPPFHHPYSLP